MHQLPTTLAILPQERNLSSPVVPSSFFDKPGNHTRLRQQSIAEKLQRLSDREAPLFITSMWLAGTSSQDLHSKDAILSNLEDWGSLNTDRKD